MQLATKVLPDVGTKGVKPSRGIAPYSVRPRSACKLGKKMAGEKIIFSFSSIHLSLFHALKFPAVLLHVHDTAYGSAMNPICMDAGTRGKFVIG